MMEINVAGMKPLIPAECFISTKHYIPSGFAHPIIYDSYINPYSWALLNQ
jgi:hypothetical protein